MFKLQPNKVANTALVTCDIYVYRDFVLNPNGEKATSRSLVSSITTSLYFHDTPIENVDLDEIKEAACDIISRLPDVESALKDEERFSINPKYVTLDYITSKYILTDVTYSTKFDDRE